MSLKEWLDYNAREKSRPDSDIIELEEVTFADGIIVLEGEAAARDIYGENHDA